MSLGNSPRSVTLRAHYRAREYVALPAFLGGTIHGALGHALESLDASHVLRPPKPPPDAPSFVHSSVPPPTVIVPSPLAKAHELAPDETLDFGILLLAPDAPRVGVLVAALEAIGRGGLGRGRGRLELDRVDDGHGRTFWRRGRVVAEPQADEDLRVSAAGPWTLRTTTPLHVLRSGKLVVSPRASDIARAAARRLVTLSWAYSGSGATDLRELDRTVEDRLGDASEGSWEVVRGERWSERQRRRHPVEGVLGSIPLGSEFDPFLPWLERTLRFGLGKGTGLGLGRLELVVRG